MTESGRRLGEDERFCHGGAGGSPAHPDHTTDHWLKGERLPRAPGLYQFMDNSVHLCSIKLTVLYNIHKNVSKWYAHFLQLNDTKLLINASGENSTSDTKYAIEYIRGALFM